MESEKNLSDPPGFMKDSEFEFPPAIGVNEKKPSNTLLMTPVLATNVDPHSPASPVRRFRSSLSFYLSISFIINQH